MPLDEWKIVGELRNLKNTENVPLDGFRKCVKIVIGPFRRLFHLVLGDLSGIAAIQMRPRNMPLEVWKNCWKKCQYPRNIRFNASKMLRFDVMLGRISERPKAEGYAV